MRSLSSTFRRSNKLRIHKESEIDSLVFSLLPGGFPYPTLGDHQILPYLAEGRRLDKPIIVSQELYATMVRCWTENPEQRPSFTELVNLLEADESRNKAYVDITTLQTSVSFPPIEIDEDFKGS